MKKTSLLAALALLVLTNLSANAAVTTQYKRNGEILITYSKSDLKKYHTFETALARSGRTIGTKCFQVQTQDDFGAPGSERRCAVLLKDEDHFNNTKRGSFIRLRDPELTDVLRNALSRRKEVVGRVMTYARTRRCTSTNSNPSCSQVLASGQRHQSLIKASAEGQDG